MMRRLNIVMVALVLFVMLVGTPLGLWVVIKGASLSLGASIKAGHIEGSFIRGGVFKDIRIRHPYYQWYIHELRTPGVRDVYKAHRVPHLHLSQAALWFNDEILPGIKSFSIPMVDQMDIDFFHHVYHVKFSDMNIKIYRMLASETLDEYGVDIQQDKHIEHSLWRFTYDEGHLKDLKAHGIWLGQKYQGDWHKNTHDWLVSGVFARAKISGVGKAKSGFLKVDMPDDLLITSERHFNLNTYIRWHGDQVVDCNFHLKNLVWDHIFLGSLKLFQAKDPDDALLLKLTNFRWMDWQLDTFHAQFRYFNDHVQFWFKTLTTEAKGVFNYRVPWVRVDQFVLKGAQQVHLAKPLKWRPDIKSLSWSLIDRLNVPRAKGMYDDGVWSVHFDHWSMYYINRLLQWVGLPWAVDGDISGEVQGKSSSLHALNMTCHACQLSSLDYGAHTDPMTLTLMKVKDELHFGESKSHILKGVLKNQDHLILDLQKLPLHLLYGDVSITGRVDLSGIMRQELNAMLSIDHGRLHTYNDILSGMPSYFRVIDKGSMSANHPSVVGKVDISVKDDVQFSLGVLSAWVHGALHLDLADSEVIAEGQIQLVPVDMTGPMTIAQASLVYQGQPISNPQVNVAIWKEQSLSQQMHPISSGYAPSRPQRFGLQVSGSFNHPDIRWLSQPDYLPANIIVQQMLAGDSGDAVAVLLNLFRVSHQVEGAEGNSLLGSSFLKHVSITSSSTSSLDPFHPENVGQGWLVEFQQQISKKIGMVYQTDMADDNSFLSLQYTPNEALMWQLYTGSYGTGLNMIRHWRFD